MNVAPAEAETMTGGRSSPDRQDAVLRAAARLFSEHGYERTNTRSIAAAAGVAEGTIFRYFPTKKHLLLAFVERIALQSLSGFAERARHMSAEDAIRAFLLDRYALWQTHGGLLRAVFAEALFDPALAREVCERITGPVTRLAEDFLSQGVSAGHYRPLDVPVAARALVGQVFAPVMLYDPFACTADEHLSPERYATEMARLFVRGIAQTGATP